MEIVFKSLIECKIEDIITAWNRGFEEYFVKLEMTPELFFNRIANEGLSLPHSIVAFDKHEPVAIVVNGIRTIGGKKYSWNGGTGIAKDYRGSGVSKLLMEEKLKIYEEEGIEVATLEAIKKNERAISLYQRYGYEIVDELVHLSGMREVDQTQAVSIHKESLRPEQLPFLTIYQENVPWQCQWQSMKQGEAQIFTDMEGKPLGYALYRRVWNAQGQLERVLLYQLHLVCDPEQGFLNAIFANICGRTDQPVTFMTINTSVKNPIVPFLLAEGFQKTAEQVQMVKKR
ncbi:GNAT family N-acetyltransferase [Neobacillus muris]|uniref:GNAT family N-acetyltransferase n=1 Tax=Neobacillus muris TaxID=2941334 RepID=UPI0020400DB3|nr:GNAT family N-acetyltransferase [Neobacillus muris]